MSTEIAVPVPPVKTYFHPALEGDIPYLDIYPNPKWQGVPVKLCVTTYYEHSKGDVIVKEEMTSQHTKRFTIPPRGKQEVLGVKLDQVHKNGNINLTEHRTLHIPNGKLMNYHGSADLQAPDDFDEYWMDAQAELARSPLDYEMIPVPEGESKTGLLYKVRLNSMGDIPICGWYYQPKDEDQQPYPAIQLMPGYGSEEPPLDRTNEGLITFALSPRGHGHSNEKFTLPEQHHLWNILEPKEYYYRQAFMDGLRGLEFLRARKEVDATRILLEGGSQGGLLTLATAALDGNVQAAVANIVTMVNFPDLLKIATEGSTLLTAQYLQKHPKLREPVLKMLNYVDLVHFVPRIQCPVLMVMGYQDRICPPHNGIVAYNRLKKQLPHKLEFDPLAAHEITFKILRQTRRFQSHYL